MHSRIFQLSTSPITPDEFITTRDISDASFNFVGEIADYVDDIPESQLTSEYVGLYRDLAHANDATPFSVNMVKLSNGAPETLIFSEGFPQGYFRKKYAEFREVLRKLDAVDAAQFADDPTGNVAYLVFLLRSAHNERFGAYIWINGDLLTLDEFVRTCELNTPYYFGNVLDYHF